MIKVTFLKKGESFTGFVLSGHSGYSQQGTDVVCAAVSSVAYMVANTVTDVIGVNAEIELEDGYMKLIPENCDGEVQTVFKGMYLHLSALSKQYKKYMSCKVKLIKE